MYKFKMEWNYCVTFFLIWFYGAVSSDSSRFRSNDSGQTLTISFYVWSYCNIVMLILFILNPDQFDRKDEHSEHWSDKTFQLYFGSLCTLAVLWFMDRNELIRCNLAIGCGVRMGKSKLDETTFDDWYNVHEILNS